MIYAIGLTLGGLIILGLLYYFAPTLPQDLAPELPACFDARHQDEPGECQYCPWMRLCLNREPTVRIIPKGELS